MTVLSIGTLGDFIAELREFKHRITLPVRWHGIRSAEQKEAVSFEVGAWATAIIGVDTDPDAYLAECMIACGRDSKATQNEGTVNAAKARTKLAEACDDIGLALRPGKYEVF
jgi:hypothetical protein